MGLTCRAAAKEGLAEFLAENVGGGPKKNMPTLLESVSKSIKLALSDRYLGLVQSSYISLVQDLLQFRAIQRV